MVLLEVALVFGAVGVLVYWTFRLVSRFHDQGRRPVSPAGHWRAAHYDVKGQTHVVLQKISTSGANVVDEHIIATVATDDPDYDAKFLTAMSIARERRALFEVEEE